VFRRYDVTQALPIEYGGVMACDALSAIIFYKEDAYMENWQLLMAIAGVATIIFGIIVGRCDKSTGIRSQFYYRFFIPLCCVNTPNSVKKMQETYVAPTKPKAAPRWETLVGGSAPADIPKMTSSIVSQQEMKQEFNRA